MDFSVRITISLTDFYAYFTKQFLTRSLREPGGPCTKFMEVSESRMERVNS